MYAFLRKSIASAMLFTGGFEPSQAQLNLEKYEFGLSAGVFVYRGDLTPSILGSYRTASPNVSLFIQRVISRDMRLRAQLAFGRLRGNDASYPHPEWRQQRSFRFQASVAELSVMLVTNPIRAGKFSPYLFGGAGFNLVGIKRDWSSFNYEYFSNEPATIAGLTEDINKPVPRLIPVIPVGFGLDYSISPKISFVIENSIRITHTDYLDGFSRSANPARKDQYHSHTIGLIFKFQKDPLIDCPDPKKKY